MEGKISVFSNFPYYAKQVVLISRTSVCEGISQHLPQEFAYRFTKADLTFNQFMN